MTQWILDLANNKDNNTKSKRFDLYYIELLNAVPSFAKMTLQNVFE